LKVIGGKDELVKFKTGEEITDEVLIKRIFLRNPEFLDVPIDNAGNIIVDKIKPKYEKEKEIAKEVIEKKPKTKKEFEDLNKNDQIELLEKYGLGDDEIKFLRLEPDRVSKLLELQKEKGVL